MTEAPGLVRRDRLLRRLDGVTAHRLTTVVADAGFGKSTLVRQWLGALTGARLAQPLSADVKGLARCLAEVVRVRDPAVAAQVDLVCEVVHEESQGQALAGLLCGALAVLPGAKVVLLVEDAHALDSAALRFLEALVRQAPPSLHALVLSRHDVPFATDRIPTQVLRLTGKDLAFDDDELSRVLTAIVGDDDDAPAVDAFAGRWPAAVRLAAESLSRRPKPERAREMQRLRRDGARDLAALAEELVDSESDAVRRLFQVLAPYDAFTPDLAGELGCPGAAELVAGLERRGLVVRLRGEWCAFPLLLRDFLRTTLPLVPQEHRELLRRAGRWLEDHGELEAALRCALEGPEPEDVERVLREHGRALVAAGHLSRVATALMVTGTEDPALAAVDAALCEARGQIDAALAGYERAGPSLAWVACRLGVLCYQRGDLQGALAALTTPSLEQQGPDDVERLAWTATVHWSRGEVDRAQSVAERALESAMQLGDDRSLAAVHTALALVAAHRGDPDANRAHYEIALCHAERGGDVAQLARIHNNLGSRFLEQGELAAARVELEKAIDLAQAGGLRFYLSLALANRGELHLHLGQFDAALVDLEAALELDRSMGSPSASSAQVHLGHVYRHRGCTTMARQAYEEAVAAGRAAGDVNLLVPALCGLAQLLAETDGDVAQACADEALSIESGLGRVGALLAAGWVALARGRSRDAAALAEQAHDQAAVRRDRLGLAESLHLAALSDPRSPDTRLERAAALLREVGTPVWLARVRLSQARRQPEGRATVVEVAQLANELGARPLADQAEALAVAFDTSRAPAPLEIRVLGGFLVRRNGRAIVQAAWTQGRARALLERLTTRTSWTHAQLARSLWPGPAAAAGDLAEVVADLRAVLDPSAEHAADHFVRDTGDLVSLNHAEVDLTAFLTEAESGLAHEDLDLLRRAEARYAGDLLEDLPGDSWVEALRQEARARYVEVTRALVRLSEPEAAARYSRRVLEHDPYDEWAHLSLVAALVAAGREPEARRCYATYLQRLDELGLEALPWGSDAPAEGVTAPR